MSNYDFFQAFIEQARDIFKTQGFVPLHAPIFGGRERELVVDTLNTTFVSSIGNYVEEFEQALASYTGARYAVATTSGTAALHVALVLAGVKAADEVVTAPLSFVATCNAIAYCGASPLFLDVDPDTLGLSPSSLANFLEEHSEIRDDGLCWNKLSGSIIRACVPVHNFGHPVRIGEISRICQENNIELIEDAAESLGSRLGKEHTGCTGLAGVLSFNGNKIITTGGGGALITDDSEIAARAKHITTTAKKPHAYEYFHDEVGFNYRLPNLNAALGCAQLEQLDSFVEAKRNLASHYFSWFKDWPDVDFFVERDQTTANYWLNAILFEEKAKQDEFLRFTNSHGVMTRPMWKSLHKLPMFKECFSGDLSQAKRIEERLVAIPSNPNSIFLN